MTGAMFSLYIMCNVASQHEGLTIADRPCRINLLDFDQMDLLLSLFGTLHYL